jgi:hypothetical protein
LTESADKTKEVLSDALLKLYEKAARRGPARPANFLQGGDGIFLGTITDNPFDRDSVTNSYGPYGSPYSRTSIRNEYSVYGSPYSGLSLNSIYANNPPFLYLRGEVRGRITKNQFIPGRINTDVFFFLLENDVHALLEGRIPNDVPVPGNIRGRSFVLAADGTFLGNLNPNKYDQESIFNQYGPYGSRYSPTSIFNPYGTYGSKYSALSPFNSYTATPPAIYVDGNEIGHLTVNKYVGGTVVDPNHVKDWAARNVATGF